MKKPVAVSPTPLQEAVGKFLSGPITGIILALVVFIIIWIFSQVSVIAIELDFVFSNPKDWNDVGRIITAVLVVIGFLIGCIGAWVNTRKPAENTDHEK